MLAAGTAQARAQVEKAGEAGGGGFMHRVVKKESDKQKTDKKTKKKKKKKNYEVKPNGKSIKAVAGGGKSGKGG